MSRRRLFWKFFFFLWLAQFATALCVGVAMSAFHHDQGPPPPPPPRAVHAPPRQPPPPPPPRSVFPPPMPILAGSLVSLVFAAVLAGYFSRPISRLRHAFEAVANGQLGTRVGQEMGRRRDELADLGQDFDRMATRLQALVDGKQRLLHDVSHELRSPLGRLQAAADLMQQQPERALELSGRMLRETARIDRLVGELLTLSRLDGTPQPLATERFNLLELIDEIVDDAGFAEQDRHVSITVDAPASLPVDGKPELLRRAIDNVLRNAIRHAPAASSIRIQASVLHAQICLDIIDSGGGVSPDELERIFEPFYRAGNAREHEGTGLGLPLARQILKMHGGTLRAEHLDDKHFAMRLQLPMAC